MSPSTNPAVSPPLSAPAGAPASAAAVPPAAARNNGRRVVALIATLLALPFVLATLLWHVGWQPGRQINHGELLATAGQPQRQLAEPAAAAWLDGHWMLALAAPGECAADCAAQLHLARQVQVALNKDMGRLKRGLIGPQLRDTASLAALRERWPDLAITRADEATWRSLDGDRIAAPRLYLIDPQGRLVLRYSPTPDPQGVRRDVERLLKYSWLG